MAISAAPTSLEEILAQEAAIEFPAFTAAMAWDLGVLLRSRCISFTPLPVTISISLATSNVLFHTVTKSGGSPDNDVWVSRKRATVLRWGRSTWYMGRKFDGDEIEFADKFGLHDNISQFAIHGGGVPIKVRGVEGTVGVIVVSGLKQDQDHQIVIEVVGEYLKTLAS